MLMKDLKELSYQWRSKAFTRPRSFLLLRQLIKTWVLFFTDCVSTESGPVLNSSSSSFWSSSGVSSDFGFNAAVESRKIHVLKYLPEIEIQQHLRYFHLRFAVRGLWIWSLPMVNDTFVDNDKFFWRSKILIVSKRVVLYFRDDKIL